MRRPAAPLVFRVGLPTAMHRTPLHRSPSYLNWRAMFRGTQQHRAVFPGRTQIRSLESRVLSLQGFFRTRNEVIIIDGSTLARQYHRCHVVKSGPLRYPWCRMLWARRDDHHQTWLRGRASEPPSGVGSGPPGVKGVGGLGGCVCVGLQFWSVGVCASWPGGPWIKLGMSRQTSFWAQKLGGSADPIRLASRSIPFAFRLSPSLTYRLSAWLRRP
ncbi:hypothetical protein EDB80DRAFT_93587 [Ilyonectria destructans]|nr:hypothetical protein EDB80DRAFT_93587 [Ilyonectria destructans]